MAKVAKKVLAILAGDKNGRKFLGYVIGIVLFIVLLPVIAVYGLFGWMAGGGAAEIVSPDMVYSAMPAEYRERMEQYTAELSMIETTFAECGVSGTDTSLAKTIYISCLIGKESEENSTGPMRIASSTQMRNTIRYRIFLLHSALPSPMRIKND